MAKYIVDKDELSEVANELIKAAKYKFEPSYKSEQDFLAALARASNKMSDDKFEELTEEAADWVNDAIQALKDKDTLPALPADEDEVEDDVDDDDEVEDDVVEDADEDEPVRKKVAAKPVEDEADDDTDEDLVDSDDDVDEDTDEPDDELDEEEPEPEPVKAKAKAKPAKEKPAKEDKPAKKRRSPREYADAEKDSFGLVKGTAVSDAVRMFEKGASMKMVKTATGSSQYNILQKLSQDGHLVEKHDGVITIKHRDKLSPKEKARVSEAQEETKERVEAVETVRRKHEKGNSSPKAKSKAVEVEADDEDEEIAPPPPQKAKGKRERVR